MIEGWAPIDCIADFAAAPRKNWCWKISITIACWSRGKEPGPSSSGVNFSLLHGILQALILCYEIGRDRHGVKGLPFRHCED
jgi:hypothetical protein